MMMTMSVVAQRNKRIVMYLCFSISIQNERSDIFVLLCGEEKINSAKSLSPKVIEPGTLGLWHLLSLHSHALTTEPGTSLIVCSLKERKYVMQNNIVPKLHFTRCHYRAQQ